MNSRWERFLTWAFRGDGTVRDETSVGERTDLPKLTDDEIEQATEKFARRMRQLRSDLERKNK